MNFTEALQKLGIEEYAERIFASNSHGELMHLEQYIDIAETFKDQDSSWFPGWFKSISANSKHRLGVSPTVVAGWSIDCLSIVY